MRIPQLTQVAWSHPSLAAIVMMKGERVGGSSAGDGLLDSCTTKKQEANNESKMWFILARQRGCPLPTRLIGRKSKKSQRKYYGAQEL